METKELNAGELEAVVGGAGSDAAKWKLSYMCFKDTGPREGARAQSLHLGSDGYLYTAVEGDCILSIADRFYSSGDAGGWLIAANELSHSSYILAPGTTVQVSFFLRY